MGSRAKRDADDKVIAEKMRKHRPPPPFDPRCKCGAPGVLGLSKWSTRTFRTETTFWCEPCAASDPEAQI